MKNSTTTIAVDLAKNVFEIAARRDGRVFQHKRLNRKQMVEYFSQTPPALVLMEACGTAHYWGRVLQGFGHEVRLLPAHRVKPFQFGNKNDRRDTGGILRAGDQDWIRPVPVKSIEHQSIGFLHRLREGWQKTRTCRLNTLRGILREFGVMIPLGSDKVLPAASLALADPAAPIPEVLHPLLLSAMAEIRDVDLRVEAVDKQLKRAAKSMPLVKLLETIPGIALINATAQVAMTGDFRRFRSGRWYASSLGLTPKENSSGDRRRLGRISKEGNTYLSTLLIAGARSAILAAHRTKKPHALQLWMLDIETRRGRNRAATALANKLARIIWAVATRGVPFRPSYPPAPSPIC
jgi:transposase